jgi:hypothetical protein
MTDPEKPKPKHPLLRTAISALVLGTLFSMKMAAVGLGYIAVFLIFWLPYSLYLIIRKPERRKVQSYKIGIWFLMIAMVLTIHQVRKVVTRNYADSVVLKIERFQQGQGRYPDSLEEVGISRAELKDKLSLAHYSNKPQFYYPDTVMIFHMWAYDFGRHDWVNEGD